MRRRRANQAEGLLWTALNEGLPRTRFMRSVPVGPYTAGFLSRAAKLIVEIDDGCAGDARDAARTRFLNGHGYRLIRFWDEDVLQDVDAVLDALACALPPELLGGDAGPRCRISGPAARAAWSPKPDYPPRPSPARDDKKPILPAGVR